MDHSELVRKLPDGPVPETLTHEDVVAKAITRAHLADDVRGINASLDIIRRTRDGRWPTEPVTEEFNYVDVSWWVTPTAYEEGYYAKVYRALVHWLTDLPFTEPYYSNHELPGAAE
jgi:hypothetical protein